MSLPDLLRAETRRLLDRAYVPYSRTPAAAVALLSNGALVPGVRVENASYSLSIPPALAAVATALARGRTDVRAVAVWPEATTTERSFLSSHPGGQLADAGDGTFFRDGETADLPAPGSVLALSEVPSTTAPEELVLHARRASERAFVPESGFRVGCVGASVDGRIVVAANVEHPDWSFILCAERIMAVAARAYGIGALTNVALSCNGGQGCAPCGACRQVLQELAPDAMLWMDRVGHSPARASLSSLLPGAFTGGDVLERHRGS